MLPKTARERPFESRILKKALSAVNRGFVLLFRELELLGGEMVAVDGSFFQANASKQSIYTEDRLDKELLALDQKIAEYQQALAEHPFGVLKQRAGMMHFFGAWPRKIPGQIQSDGIGI